MKYAVAHKSTDEALICDTLVEAMRLIEDEIRDGHDKDDFILFEATQIGLNIKVTHNVTIDVLKR